MDAAQIHELQEYVAFDEQDALNLRALGSCLDDIAPAAIDRFYQELQRHPGARAVLRGGPQQIARLREAFREWLKQLFYGAYDAGYWRERAEVGRVHARIGLPQQYMVAAMQIVWEELERGIRGLGRPDAVAKLYSLHKLLSLELAVMLDSYQAGYSEQIRTTEREAVQERLTEAEHLAQIGSLAASLAHEIKNPLAGISGAIQVIRDSLASDAPHRPILDEILRQVNRLDGTVKDLLVYARPKPPKFRKVHLDELIAHLATALGTQPEMQRVRFEHVNSRKLPTIQADEHQIEQLLTNLLLNAAQASPDGGLVRLTAGTHPNGVRICVEDRGQGMSEDVRRRAAEPFFTTKAKGTGLGLPICRKIVETHGGRLTIRSEVGSGTEVIIDLPQEQPELEGNEHDDSRSAR